MDPTNRAEFEALRSALDVTADAIARITPVGRIAWANEAFGNLMATPPADLVGRDLASLAIPEHAERVEEAVARLMERGRAVLEATCARPGRSGIDVRCHLRAGHVVVHERAREARAEALSRTLVDLARDPGMHEGHRAEGLRLVTRTVAEALEVERVSVWIATDDDTKIEAIALFETGPGRHSAGAVLTHDQCPRYFAALEDAHTLAADDAQSDPRTQGFNKAYLVPLGIRALLDVPIRRDGKTIGVVCQEHVGAPRRWLPEERYFAASVADLVALLLAEHERRITERLLRQAEEQLRQAQKMEALGRLAGGIAPRPRSSSPRRRGWDWSGPRGPQPARSGRRCGPVWCWRPPPGSPRRPSRRDCGCRWTWSRHGGAGLLGWAWPGWRTAPARGDRPG